MRILGTEPSSVILSQTRELKNMRNDVKSAKKKVKPKGMM